MSRLLGHVWPGQREPQLAGILRDVRHSGSWRAEGTLAKLGAGFLPSVYQGTAFKPQGDPIENLKRPGDLGDEQQRAQLGLLKKLNSKSADAELAARVESFELAYRMQMAAPEALDINKESKTTHAMYGLDNPKATHFAKQCLVARRLVERGVRFVQVYSGGMENDLSWDGHSNIQKNHGGFAMETDQPIAGLLADLDARGLLDSTLVIWGGEFGRLPIVQKGSTGRDHNPHAFTVLDGGRRREGGRASRCDRRDWLQGCRGSGQHQRSARDHPESDLGWITRS